MTDIYLSWLDTMTQAGGLAPMDDVARALLRAHLSGCEACRSDPRFTRVVREILDGGETHNPTKGAMSAKA